MYGVNRVVRATDFLHHFSSDRMHMYDGDTETWSATPPSYKSIQRNGCSSNLFDFVSMAELAIDLSGGDSEKKKSAAIVQGISKVYTLHKLRGCFL